MNNGPVLINVFTVDTAKQSMQVAYDALNERQKKVFVEKMTAALSPGGPP